VIDGVIYEPVYAREPLDMRVVSRETARRLVYNHAVTDLCDRRLTAPGVHRAIYGNLLGET